MASAKPRIAWTALRIASTASRIAWGSMAAVGWPMRRHRYRPTHRRCGRRQPRRSMACRWPPSSQRGGAACPASPARAPSRSCPTAPLGPTPAAGLPAGPPVSGARPAGYRLRRAPAPARPARRAHSPLCPAPRPGASALCAPRAPSRQSRAPHSASRAMPPLSRATRPAFPPACGSSARRAPRTQPSTRAHGIRLGVLPLAAPAPPLSSEYYRTITQR
jgi:hypothetical protein